MLYTGGCLTRPLLSRSAMSLLRHLGSRVVGVIDDRQAATTLESITELASFGAIPVFRRPDELDDREADLVVAMDLPRSNRLLPRHRSEIFDAAASGRRVWNSLHEPLRHPMIRNLRSIELGERGDASGSTLLSKRILCVAADRNAAALETSIALTAALRERGRNSDWLPMSPAGLLLRGYGRCLDASASQAAPHIIEQLVMGLEAHAACIVIEGPGSLSNPSDAALVAGVAAGARSEYHVLCHRPETAEETQQVLLEAADRCEALHRAVGIRSRLLGISLDPSGIEANEIHRATAAARSLGVPCVVARSERSCAWPIDPSLLADAVDVLDPTMTP